MSASVVSGLFLILIVIGAFGCRPKEISAEAKPPAPEQPGELLRVGSISIRQQDLDFHLNQNQTLASAEAAREDALDQLTTTAQFAQEALDSGLENDPVVRAEIARVLATRLRETILNPRLQEISQSVSDARLRELYQADLARYQLNEKRQIAVLWLDPKDDPQRKQQYEKKMAAARDWFLANSDLPRHPEQGFSVLSVDGSEHADSRYNGGIVGWYEAAGGVDAWSKQLAKIAFSLKEPGDISEVTSGPEGIFLVRYMALRPASVRPFEAVSAEIAQAEKQRLRTAAERQFDEAIKSKHPVQRLSN